jgi:glycine cleavage system H protein
MKFVSDNNATGRVTPRKYRCVWMEAGILSYLLCDREFDCEHCPLDEAMRSHYSGIPANEPDAPDDGIRRDDDRRVRREEERTPAWSASTDEHVAVTVMEGGVLRVSIEETAAGFLPPLKSVVLPVPGRTITAGSLCCWLIFEGGTLPIRIPFPGRVEGVNPELAERPHLAAESPSGRGWLFDITPSDSAGALRGLLSPEEADECNFRDGQNFHRLIGECIRPPGGTVGATMQDGGHPITDLPTIIGPVKYLEIVRRAFWGKR